MLSGRIILNNAKCIDPQIWDLQSSASRDRIDNDRLELLTDFLKGSAFFKKTFV
jgi:hypothetical protein